MLVLVLVAVLLVGLLAFTSAFQASGSRRTTRRILDVRSAIEAGDSALSEAVILIRKSMDTGWSDPSLCPDNWRQLLLAVQTDAASLPRGRTVVPRHTRSLHQDDAAPIRVGNVTVDVISNLVPAATAASPAPPQGVLELSVDVAGSQKLVSISRRIRQRRAYYLTVDPRYLVPGVPIPPDVVTLTLLTHPLGTVVE
jgi:hypothetical protein